MPTLHQSSKNKSKRIKKHHYTDVRSLFNSPHKRGHVVKVRIMSPKKPNSAKRKVARIRLSNRYMVTAKIKGQGHNLQAYSQVLVSGGRANDLPGVRYNMVKGKFSFNWKERDVRSKGRSKYGLKVEDYIYALEEKEAKEKRDEEEKIKKKN